MNKMADFLFGKTGARHENAGAEDMSKTAMSHDEKMKYLKASIIAAVGAAGIGAFARAKSARKRREKALDVSKSKNAIIVDVKKKTFLDGLPTPQELAESRGELAQMPSDAVHDVQAELPAPPGEGLSEKEIEDRKKEILRGRKVDFFSKRAKDGDEGGEKEDSREDEKDDGKKKISEEEYDGRTILRDQTGKFVSPTDPVAVQQAEKDAGVKGFSDIFLHPIDSAERVVDAAKGHPVVFTAGALGSMYIAAKLSNAIGEIRKRRAKKRLDEARDKYVELLEDPESEKVADADIRDLTGAAIGASFIVPLALTALVTNRIIENRRKEKEKRKEVSDSYPDDPYVLYKVSEDRSMKVSPEAMLTLLSIKRAMIEDAEAEEALRLSGACEKTAQADNGQKNWFQRFVNKLDGVYKNAVLGYLGRYGIKFTSEDFDKYINDAKPFSDDEAYDELYKSLAGDENNGTLMSMVNGYLARKPGETYDIKKDTATLLNSMDPATRARYIRTMLGKVKYEIKDGKTQLDTSGIESHLNGMKERFAKDRRMQELLLKRMDSPAYADVWNPIIEGQVNKYLTSKEGWGLDKNGFLFKVISWIANNTGLGKYFAKRHLNNMFYAARKPQQNASGGAQQGGWAPQTPAHTTSPHGGSGGTSPQQPPQPPRAP